MIDTTLFPALKVAASKFSLSVNYTQGVTRGGEVIRVGVGARLWAGTVSVAPAYYHQLAALEALLAESDAAGRFILAYDARFDGPRLDPTGAILGAATPTIHTLDADSRRMRVTGLPAGYQLRTGDYIGWQYGSGPVRYALHRLTSDADASGAGLTPLFSVVPHIRPGAAVGAAVSLVRPVCKCVISADYGAGSRLISQGPQITLTQTLR